MFFQLLITFLSSLKPLKNNWKNADRTQLKHIFNFCFSSVRRKRMVAIPVEVLTPLSPVVKSKTLGQLLPSWWATWGILWWFFTGFEWGLSYKLQQVLDEYSRTGPAWYEGAQYGAGHRWAVPPLGVYGHRPDLGLSHWRCRQNTVFRSRGKPGGKNSSIIDDELTVPTYIYKVKSLFMGRWVGIII